MLRRMVIHRALELLLENKPLKRVGNIEFYIIMSLTFRDLRLSNAHFCVCV